MVQFILLVFTYECVFAQVVKQDDGNTIRVLNTKDTIDHLWEQKYPDFEELHSTNKVSTRLQVDVMPILAEWYWDEEHLKPNGYKDYIDKLSIHSPFNSLAAVLRIRGQAVQNDTLHKRLKQAADYAAARGIHLLGDMDVRVASFGDFVAMYPDEVQEMLRLQEFELSGHDTIKTVVLSEGLKDRYNYYTILQGSLLRVYSYDLTSDGIIELQTLNDITKECITDHSSIDSVVISIPVDYKNSKTRACVMVSFTYLIPDVFAPHLMAFQREIIQSYADVQLAGGYLGEWGFPASRNPETNEFWYSKYRAKAYAERTGGRELLSDCLLMYVGIKGQESERQMAINHFMEMSWQRNGALENNFYHAVKKVFGPLAIVETHPTWWPFPDWHEFKKNGLDWWVATRDWAQTDETTPFAVRTSLSKKWRSPVWYNMYYAPEEVDYQHELWSSALAGGRINYHPYRYRVNKQPPRETRHLELLRGDLMRGESRVRLLNYISTSPSDCPVAVVFGHACAMNWAGPAYNDVGMDLVDSLWREGIMTDLIPTSEIENENLYIDKEGWICYGPQRYSAVILYNPEFDKLSTAKLFHTAQKGHTSMFRIGDWTKDFDGQVFDGNAALPELMIAHDSATAIISDIHKILKKQEIDLQTPATENIGGGFLGSNSVFRYSSSPPTTGFCRLINGTIIQVAGTDNVSGDSIQSTIKVQGHKVFFDAIGVAAVRINDDGQVQAMVAGGLKSFKTGDFEIKLKDRIDIALWIDDTGRWEGVIQGWNKEIPSELLAITENWVHLDIPIPLFE